MARVIPGSDIKELYDERNIYSSNIQGDDYKVRRSANDANLDPRANSFWQKQVIDKMSLAARIWKNKKPCWQDHFKRSKKQFQYGTSWDGAVYKTLTGYKLAINMLMQTLGNFDGNFYDPDCFCITPVDMLGYIHDSHYRLEVKHFKPVEYIYDETKRPCRYAWKDEQDKDPFCSATKPYQGYYETCRLSAPYVAERNNSGYAFVSELSALKYVVGWFPFYLIPNDVIWQYPIYVWNSPYWMWNERTRNEMPYGDTFTRVLELRLKDPSNSDVLCNHGYLGLNLMWGGDNLDAEVVYTHNSPTWDLWYGNNFLGTYGSGSGSQVTKYLNIPKEPYSPTSASPLRFNDALQLPKLSWQPEWYPQGKLTEARLLGNSFSRQRGFECVYGQITQRFVTDDYIHFHPFTNEPQIKLNIWGYHYDTRGFQSWYPWGGFFFYACEDDWTCHNIASPATVWATDGSRMEICISNDLLYGDYKNFQVVWFNTAYNYWDNYVYTMFGDPICETDVNENGCPMPAVGQRGLFFVEKNKPFELKDPCCRCPEYFPPDCTVLPRCPGLGGKALLNNDCYIVQSASPRYLVYDHLH